MFVMYCRWMLKVLCSPVFFLGKWQQTHEAIKALNDFQGSRTVNTFFTHAFLSVSAVSELLWCAGRPGGEFFHVQSHLCCPEAVERRRLCRHCLRCLSGKVCLTSSWFCFEVALLGFFLEQHRVCFQCRCPKCLVCIIKGWKKIWKNYVLIFQRHFFVHFKICIFVCLLCLLACS